MQETVERATAVPWLTYREAAKHTKFSPWTLRRAVLRGELEASGSDRGTRFRIEELDRWMFERA